MAVLERVAVYLDELLTELHKAGLALDGMDRLDGLLAEIDDQEAIRRELAGLTPAALGGRRITTETALAS